MREPFPFSVINVRLVGLKSLSSLFEQLLVFPGLRCSSVYFVQCAMSNLSVERACDMVFESNDPFLLSRKSERGAAHYG